MIVSPEDPTISESEMVVMIKRADKFINADLAGTWYISGASAGNAVPANDGTINGNLTLNAAGAITGGSITLPGLTALFPSQGEA